MAPIKNKYVDKWFLIGFFLALSVTYSLHALISPSIEPPILLESNWFNNDTRIEEILLDKVETNYTFFKLDQPRYISSKNAQGVTPFFGRTDVWRRYYAFYPLNPETTPDSENWVLWGFIYIDGEIRIVDLLPKDSAYG